MPQHLTVYSMALLLGAYALLGLQAAHSFSSVVEPVLWNSQQKSAAWASGTSLGHTSYQHSWKPRVAIGLDFASEDGDTNCVTPGGSLARSCGGNASTFEKFFPTNFLHVGYMLNGAWRNSGQPQIDFQARPTARDHIAIWALHKYLASAR